MTRYQIFTDGACSGNPGRGGLGAVIVTEENIVCKEISKGFHKTTNNRMEILAVAEGLSALREFVKDYSNKYGTRETDIKVTVCSDSQLVVNCMAAGWGRKSNLDLWKEVDEQVFLFKNEIQGSQIEFLKVKGHADNKYNNLADRLAVAGSQNPTEPDTVYEKICQERQTTVFQENHSAEPVITDVKFCGMHRREGRHVEIYLSNGTVVKIIPYHGGFEQTGCTQAEAKITVSLAWKYVKWLNGNN